MAYPVVAATSSAVYTVTGGLGTGNVNITLPSGTAAGDLLVVKTAAYDGTGGATPITGTGWTSLSGQTNATSSFSTLWKIATSADVSSGLFNFSGLPASNNGIVVNIRMVRITGADPTLPISNDVHAAGSGTAAATTGFTSTMNVLFLEFVSSVRNAGSVVVSVAGYAIASNNPSWTESYDDSSSDTSNTSRAGSAMAWGTQSVIAATGNATATITNGTTAYHMSFIGVIPAPIVATPISMTATMGTVVVPFVATALSVITTIGVPTVSSIAKMWTTATKHVSVWVNGTKH